MKTISIAKVPYTAKIFYMFMMFMWVANVSGYTSFNLGKNPILMPVYMIILGYYYAKYCNKSFKPLFLVIGIFVFWHIVSFLKYGGIIGFNFPPFYNILIVHVAFNIYRKDEFLLLFEKILVFFCCISLVVWVLVNILGTPFVSLMRLISVIQPSTPTETYSFLFGICSQLEFGIRRNLGFTWEPGRFACWLLLGLYVNLILHRFKISYKNNCSFYILFLSLISTFSTTGYTLLFLMVLFYFINKKGVFSKLFIFLGVILALPSIIGLSFMADKFSTLSNVNNDISIIDYHIIEGDMEVITPQRFTGILLSFQNFIHDFFCGYNQLAYSYTNACLFKNSIIVAPSEGIFEMLAKYGIFVGLFLYYWLVKSSILLGECYRYKGKWFFLIFFVLISFSYDFWENCILMYFYFCALYRSKDVNYVQ